MNAPTPAGSQAFTPYASMSADRPEMPSVGLAREFRIRRMGARPLVFRGTELAMSMSFSPELPYWYEMNIYRTEQQSFVLAIRMFFQSEDIRDHARAWELETIGDVFDRIEAYDAAQDIRLSLPDTLDGAAPAELAAHALDLSARVAAARAHFAGLVGELFAEIETSAA